MEMAPDGCTRNTQEKILISTIFPHEISNFVFVLQRAIGYFRRVCRIYPTSNQNFDEILEATVFLRSFFVFHQYDKEYY